MYHSFSLGPFLATRKGQDLTRSGHGSRLPKPDKSEAGSLPSQPAGISQDAADSMSQQPMEEQHDDADDPLQPSAERRNEVNDSLHPSAEQHDDVSDSLHPSAEHRNDADDSLKPSAEQRDGVDSFLSSAEQHDDVDSLQPSAEHGNDADDSPKPSAEQHDDVASLQPSAEHHDDVSVTNQPSADHGNDAGDSQQSIGHQQDNSVSYQLRKEDEQDAEHASLQIASEHQNYTDTPQQLTEGPRNAAYNISPQAGAEEGADGTVRLSLQTVLEGQSEKDKTDQQIQNEALNLPHQSAGQERSETNRTWSPALQYLLFDDVDMKETVQLSLHPYDKPQESIVTVKQGPENDPKENAEDCVEATNSDDHKERGKLSQDEEGIGVVWNETLMTPHQSTAEDSPADTNDTSRQVAEGKENRLNALREDFEAGDATETAEQPQQEALRLSGKVSPVPETEEEDPNKIPTLPRHSEKGDTRVQDISIGSENLIENKVTAPLHPDTDIQDKAVNTPRPLMKGDQNEEVLTPYRTEEEYRSDTVMTPDSTEEKYQSDTVLIQNRTEEEYHSDTVMTPDRTQQEHQSDTVLMQNRTQEEYHSDTVLTPDRTQKEYHNDTVMTPDRTQKEYHNDTVMTPDRTQKEYHNDTVMTPDRTQKEYHSDTVLTLDRTQKEYHNDTVMTPDRTQKEYHNDAVMTPDRTQKEYHNDTVMTPDRTQKEYHNDAVMTPYPASTQPYMETPHHYEADDVVARILNTQVQNFSHGKSRPRRGRWKEMIRIIMQISKGLIYPAPENAEQT